MPAELIELIPEFSEIQDPDLRKRTMAVWEEALERGNWQIEDLPGIPYTLLIPEVDISFPTHVSVVCRLCLAMEEVLSEAYGSRYPIDRDTLIAGALLADVGKLLEFEKTGEGFRWSPTYKHLRHPFTAVGLCFKHGIPEAVMHIVATHSWEGDRFNRQPESILFHHADFTDFELSKWAQGG